MKSERSGNIRYGPQVDMAHLFDHVVGGLHWQRLCVIINSCLVGACTGGRRVSHLNDDLQYDNDQHTAALQPEIKRFIRQVFAGLSYRRAP
jgi:hypothetical protein